MRRIAFRNGGTIFEHTCHCAFAHNYPWAYGPRLGIAYQVISKTVIRVGAGLSYTKTPANNYQSYAVASNTPYQAPAYGTQAYLLRNGLPYHVTFPNFDPGQLPYRRVRQRVAEGVRAGALKGRVSGALPRPLLPTAP